MIDNTQAREESLTMINNLGKKVELSLEGLSKDLKGVSSNKLRRITLAVLGYGIVFDHDDLTGLLQSQEEVDLFNRMRIIETDKVNALIHTLSVEAIDKNTQQEEKKDE
jgi:hypothetical protein